jgi:hypothetical protein
MKTLFNISAKFKNEKGVTLVYVALLLVVFLGIAAFAIDIGYHRVVRNQLQNAADAAALAACNRFYRDPLNVSAVPPPDPDWAAASAEATRAIAINKADNKALSVGTIATGWWNITQPSLGLRANSFTPTVNDGPAVSVTITKSGSQNAGPIVNFFGAILGVSTTDAGATATAVAASPGSATSGAVVPVAIPKSVADLSNNYNSPSKLLAIGSPYLSPLAGQWTSFQLNTNNTPSVQGLISAGNPTMLNIGDNIWIQPGVEAVLYDNKNQPSIQNTYAGQDVFFPIIDAIPSKLPNPAPIEGYIGFHIVCGGSGCNGMTPDGKKNEQIIMGYFITGPGYGGGSVGPHYGPLDRCRLCQ